MSTQPGEQKEEMKVAENGLDESGDSRPLVQREKEFQPLNTTMTTSENEEDQTKMDTGNKDGLGGERTIDANKTTGADAVDDSVTKDTNGNKVTFASDEHQNVRTNGKDPSDATDTVFDKSQVTGDGNDIEKTALTGKGPEGPIGGEEWVTPSEGLTTAQVEKSRDTYGLNEIPVHVTPTYVLVSMLSHGCGFPSCSYCSTVGFHGHPKIGIFSWSIWILYLHLF